MALRYNGIEFVYPNTEVHSMGPGMDPSNTDQLYTVIKLRVRSLINVELPPSSDANDANVQETLTRVRHMLTSPRKPMYFDSDSLPGQRGANPIIDLPQGMDDANGPMPDPDAFSIVYTTPGSLEVTWAVTVKIRDCDPTNPTEPLSVRWEETVSWDRFFKCTRIRNGEVIMSSRSAVSIDTYRRNKLAPLVYPGFHRTGSKYTISRDGLTCSFSFVDEQLRWTPPPPAVDMELTQSESFPLLNGMRVGQVDVSLRGHIGASVVDLQRIAMTVGRARAWASEPLKSGTAVVGNAVFSTSETPDRVTVNFRLEYKIPPTKTRKGKANSPNFWGGVGAFALGGAGGLASYLFYPRDAPKTEEGKSVGGFPDMPWVGHGTGRKSAEFPTGYAKWANPTGSIIPPADGVGLARAVKLYAELLGDPCGRDAELRSDTNTNVLRATVNTGSNNPASGNGGDPDGSVVAESVLVAEFGNIVPSQNPTVTEAAEADGLFTWDGKNAVYDHWQSLTEYTTDHGILVVPTCNPSGTNIKVRHSSDSLRVVVRWSAKRTGSPPALPPAESDNVQLVLVHEYRAPREVRVGPDGVSVIYECKGVYEYEALDPAKVQELCSVPPFLTPTGLKTASKWLEGPSLVGVR